MKLALLIFLLLPVIAWSQLPKPAILAENGIKSVEVWKHRLPPEVDGRNTFLKRREVAQIKRTIPKKRHVSNWFFNTDGYPDSCAIFDEYSKQKKTYIFQYDERKRVVFLQINIDDVLKSKDKVVSNANGNIELQYWDKDHSEWKVGYTLREDSLFIRSETISDSTGYYFDDRSTGVIGRAIIKEGKVANRYSEQWIVDENGNPDSVIITFVQLEEKKGRSWMGESSVKRFKLREDGSVVNESGRDFYTLNFYKRGNWKKPLKEKLGVLYFLNSNELVDESVVMSERRFSGVHPRYYWEFIYTK